MVGVVCKVRPLVVPCASLCVKERKKRESRGCADVNNDAASRARCFSSASVTDVCTRSFSLNVSFSVRGHQIGDEAAVKSKLYKM